MKKYLILTMLALITATPVFANTVKQNNYSEELNNQIVNDYVTKRIRVNEEPLPGANIYEGMPEVEYLAVKKQVLRALQAKYAYYEKYYTLKLADLSNSLDRVKATSSTRSVTDQQAILMLHQKNINEMIEQRNQVLGLIQGRINNVQAEIDSSKQKQQ